MRFIDKNGQEIITINELFSNKKFIRGTESYFLFFDYITNEEEKWTFINDLFFRIPTYTSKEKMKEILENYGWCKKVENDLFN